MRSVKLFVPMIFSMIFFSGGCHSQDGSSKKLIHREPYAAGRFYEGSKTTLENNLKELFGEAVQKRYSNVIAIISPHAGYPFSGEVAASAFNQIGEKRKYENVFVIASSHRVAFQGASIYNRGDYVTPLGNVKVDIELADKLISENNIFTFKEDAHQGEHSLEVQLPFLQYKLGNDINMIPIIVGTQNQDDCKSLAKILKPFFNENNLFIISTDFSHFPEYEDAIEVDKATAEAILTKSPDKLRETIGENSRKGIGGLATSLCGWSSVYTLLYMIQDDPDFNIHEIQYKNSGDAEYYGDKNRVVGYYAMAVTSKADNKESRQEEFKLTEKDKEDLIEIARKTVESYIKNGKIPEFNESDYSDNLKQHCGAFVTLNKDKRLRGCIGRFSPGKPLYKVVVDMAIAAATQDYRFPKVDESELDDIHIEISVLTPLKKIDDVNEIELGKHGIYIKKGTSSGTFLPQVATQTGWNLEEFLGHCAQDKARIGWDGWKDADVFTYEAIVFEED